MTQRTEARQRPRVEYRGYSIDGKKIVERVILHEEVVTIPSCPEGFGWGSIDEQSIALAKRLAEQFMPSRAADSVALWLAKALFSFEAKGKGWSISEQDLRNLIQRCLVKRAIINRVEKAMTADSAEGRFLIESVPDYFQQEVIAMRQAWVALQKNDQVDEQEAKMFGDFIERKDDNAGSAFLADPYTAEERERFERETEIKEDPDPDMPY